MLSKAWNMTSIISRRTRFLNPGFNKEKFITVWVKGFRIAGQVFSWSSEFEFDHWRFLNFTDVV
jgi:hypothetical protein